MAILYNGAVHKVVMQEHVKPGKGPAFVRMKLKRIDTGATIDHTFRGGEKVEQAILTTRHLEYLYRDGNQMVFMDNTTYEQTPVDIEDIGEGVDFLPENTTVAFVMYGDDIISVDLPDTVTVEISKTDPGLKGDTATGATKPATIVTGADVQVPLFIDEGDLISVNIKTGKYLGRA